MLTEDLIRVPGSVNALQVMAIDNIAKLLTGFKDGKHLANFIRAHGLRPIEYMEELSYNEAVDIIRISKKLK